MKRSLRAVCLLAGMVTTAVLCGCEETPQIPDPDVMPRAQTITQTSSTYTGTTVEYVPSSSVQTRRRSNIDMPDMPDFPSGDMLAGGGPFGREFYELFGAEYPDYSVAPEDDGGEQLSGTETSAPPAGFSDISVSREDVPEEAMADIDGSVSAVRVENPFGDFEMPDYEFSEMPRAVTEPADTAETVTAGTMPATRGFDINDYMPDDIEFPDFGDIEFDTADYNS